MGQERTPRENFRFFLQVKPITSGRGYDSDPFREILVEKGGTPVIPGKKVRKQPFSMMSIRIKNEMLSKGSLDALKSFEELQHVMIKRFACLKELSCLLRSSCGVNFEDRA